jgi:hypothetical protein
VGINISLVVFQYILMFFTHSSLLMVFLI